LAFLFFAYAVLSGFCLAIKKRKMDVVVWMPRWYRKRESRYFNAILEAVSFVVILTAIVLLVTGVGAMAGGVLGIIGAKSRGK
jgi:hypothetical protein